MYVYVALIILRNALRRPNGEIKYTKTPEGMEHGTIWRGGEGFAVMEDVAQVDVLVPVNSNSAWARGSDTDASVRFTFQPLQSTFVVLEQRFKSLHALLVVIL